MVSKPTRNLPTTQPGTALQTNTQEKNKRPRARNAKLHIPDNYFISQVTINNQVYYIAGSLTLDIDGEIVAMQPWFAPAEINPDDKGSRIKRFRRRLDPARAIQVQTYRPNADTVER